MANEITQTGAGNLAFQDIHDSAFTIFIGQSFEYKSKVRELERLRQLFARTPETEGAERLQLSGECAGIFACDRIIACV
jgi:hypothetical protein